MKKKSIISVFLVLLLLVTALAGGKESAEKNPAQENIKIGMVSYLDTGLFGVAIDYIKTLTTALGIELELEVGAFSQEEQIVAVENLIAKGCEGIMICNFGEEVLVEIAQICEEEEVYWVQNYRDVSNIEIESALSASKYYVGRCYEDNEVVGIDIAEQFSKMGLTKVAIVGPHTGETSTDILAAAFKERAELYGMNICAEVRGCEEAFECCAAVEAIAETYPDVEGILCLSGATGKLEGVLEGLEKTGLLGKVKVASMDASENIVEDMEAGYVQIAFSGQYTNTGFALAMLLNAVMDSPLSEEKIILGGRYIPFMSEQDARDYKNYVENVEEQIYAYTPEEFSQFIQVYNPDATLELLQDAVLNYSVADVKVRHGIQ